MECPGYFSTVAGHRRNPEVDVPCRMDGHLAGHLRVLQQGGRLHHWHGEVRHWEKLSTARFQGKHREAEHQNCWDFFPKNIQLKAAQATRI